VNAQFEELRNLRGTLGLPGTVAPFRAWRGSRDLVARSPKFHDLAVNHSRLQIKLSIPLKAPPISASALSSWIARSISAFGLWGELSFGIQLLFLKSKRYSFGANLAVRFPYGVLKRGLASSSVDADSGCSAFQRIVAVIRVRPLG
jgi:hypothetical protein